MELNKYEQQEREHYNKYYGQLVGATIVSAGVVAEDDFGSVNFWPTIAVKLANGMDIVLEVSQDPEGNGPGFLFGLPNVQSKVAK